MTINRIVGGIALAISIIGLLASLSTVAGGSPAGAIIGAVFCLIGVLGGIGLFKRWRYSRTVTGVFLLMVGCAGAYGDPSGGPIGLLIACVVMAGLLLFDWWRQSRQLAPAS